MSDSNVSPIWSLPKASSSETGSMVDFENQLSEIDTQPKITSEDIRTANKFYRIETDIDFPVFIAKSSYVESIRGKIQNIYGIDDRPTANFLVMSTTTAISRFFERLGVRLYPFSSAFIFPENHSNEFAKRFFKQIGLPSTILPDIQRVIVSEKDDIDRKLAHEIVHSLSGEGLKDQDGNILVLDEALTEMLAVIAIYAADSINDPSKALEIARTKSTGYRDFVPTLIDILKYIQNIRSRCATRIDKNDFNVIKWVASIYFDNKSDGYEKFSNFIKGIRTFIDNSNLTLEEIQKEIPELGKKLNILSETTQSFKDRLLKSKYKEYGYA